MVATKCTREINGGKYSPGLKEVGGGEIMSWENDIWVKIKVWRQVYDISTSLQGPGTCSYHATILDKIATKHSSLLHINMLKYIVIYI